MWSHTSQNKHHKRVRIFEGPQRSIGKQYENGGLGQPDNGLLNRPVSMVSALSCTILTIIVPAHLPRRRWRHGVQQCGELPVAFKSGHVSQKIVRAEQVSKSLLRCLKLEDPSWSDSSSSLSASKTSLSGNATKLLTCMRHSLWRATCQNGSSDVQLLRNASGASSPRPCPGQFQEECPSLSGPRYQCRVVEVNGV